MCGSGSTDSGLVCTYYDFLPNQKDEQKVGPPERGLWESISYRNIRETGRFTLNPLPTLECFTVNDVVCKM